MSDLEHQPHPFLSQASLVDDYDIDDLPSLVFGVYNIIVFSRLHRVFETGDLT